MPPLARPRVMFPLALTLLVIIIYYSSAPSRSLALSTFSPPSPFAYSPSSTRLVPTPEILALRSLVAEPRLDSNAVLDAPFDGPAFRIPHYLAARVGHWTAPAVLAHEGYDAERVYWPKRQLKKRGPMVPRMIYQTWKTDVVGPRMMQAMGSWMEMNPE